MVECDVRETVALEGARKRVPYGTLGKRGYTDRLMYLDPRLLETR